MDSFLRRFAFCVPLLITLNDHFVSVKCVEGESMQPTLNPEESLGVSDYVLIAKWNDSAPYRRGEIVALSAPDEPRHLLVKRIIALEGDVIHNGKATKVPKGHCWIEGDNQRRSVDSNRYGPVPLALIDGRVRAIVWPPSRTQVIPLEAPASSRFVRKSSKHRDVA